MRKGLLSFSFIVVSLGLIATAFLYFHLREPSYEGRPLRSWLEDARSINPEKRQKVFEAIRAMGDKGRRRLAEEAAAKETRWQKWLEELPFVEVEYTRPAMRRRRALEVFKELGPDGSPAVPHLVRVLRNEANDDAKASVIRALAWVAEPDPKVVAAVAEALEGGGRATQRAGVRLLKGWGTEASDATGALTRLLEERAVDNPWVSAVPGTPRELYRAVGTIGAGKREAFFALVSAGEDPSDHRGARGMHDWLAGSEESFEVLCDLIEDEDLAMEYRRAAIHLLGRSENSDQALDPLAESLKLANRELRIEVVGAIGRHGSDAKSVAPLLLAMLEEAAQDDPALGLEILKALEKVRPDPAITLAVLLKVAHQAYWLDASAPPGFRRGSLPHEAFSHFSRRTRGLDPDGPRASIGSALTEYANHPDWRVRVTCVIGMRLPFVELQPEAIEMLGETLEDENAYVRLHAAMTLITRDMMSGQALVKLIEAVTDDHMPAVLRSQVISRLGLKAPGRAAAGESVRALVAALQDDEVRVRAAAARTLGRFGDSAEPSVPALIDRLDDDETHGVGETEFSVREYAVKALGEIGPEAQAALPILRKMAREGQGEGRLRQWAEEAITKILAANLE